MKGFRLASVLRARRAQETVAKTEAARARIIADTAAGQIRSRNNVLDSRSGPAGATATAFAASLWARQALAAAINTAVEAAAEADQLADDRRADLAAASTRRKIMEQLEERHAVTRRHTAELADRNALDDLSAVAHERRRTGQDLP